jgi:hypothetical protein
MVDLAIKTGNSSNNYDIQWVGLSFSETWQAIM